MDYSIKVIMIFTIRPPRNLVNQMNFGCMNMKKKKKYIWPYWPGFGEPYEMLLGLILFEMSQGNVWNVFRPVKSKLNSAR